METISNLDYNEKHYVEHWAVITAQKLWKQLALFYCYRII